MKAGMLSLFGSLWLYSTAYAYLDPGTGSYACQLMLAGLMGGAFLIRLYWRRIRSSISSFFLKGSGGRDV
ncbi:MAG: hypothetical protein ACM3S0_13310 [Acidobacteriota bacterium]